MADILDRLKAALAGRYRIEHELGSGGMATVYLAQDLKHERHVAVKVFRPELAAALGTERFFREIKVTANLSHPHILPLLDSGEADGFLYYVMPLVEGDSLRNKLNREKQLSVDEAVKVTSQVAGALAYAHARDIVHRDIKPENILFQAGEIVVADFGIALAVDSAGGTRLTETGFSLGTPAYMSPEQVSGEQEIDGRSDVYSLACVLYEMLAGDPPFVASNPRAVLAKHMTDPAPPVTTVRSDVPEPVAAAVAKALGKAPVARFDSAEGFTDALLVTDAQGGEEKKSIVVLPFENLSPDPENEYFSDGLTDEMIADLSKLKALRVISRNTAMQLKRTDKDTKTIGRELNVQYVLEGTVRRVGDRLRVTAQLIDAAKDAHLWTEKYDGVLDDVFDMQERVSRSIIDALEVELSPTERTRLAERPIQDVTAHECYLKARADVLLFTEASQDRAMGLLDRGLEIAGENDALLAEKSHVYLQYVNNLSKPVETFSALLDEARTLASRALAVNPDSAMAEFSLGAICSQSCEPKGAIYHWSRAVELNPSDALAAAFLGFQLAAGGRDLDRARKLCSWAAELDLLTTLNKGALGWVQCFECNFDAALDGWRDWQREAEQAESSLPRLLLAWLHAENGNQDEAFRLFDQMALDSPGHVLTAIGSVLRHAVLGEKQKVLMAVSQQLEKTAWWDDLYSYIMAQSYALISELDRAAYWLNRAIDYGYCNTYFLKREPYIDNLRSDDRFEPLIEKARRLSESLLD